MRNLKFRAWDNYNKEMLYPVKAGINGLRSCDILERFENVMQFIGRKDKNGKEIYECDKISFLNRDKVRLKGVIKYRLASFYIDAVIHYYSWMDYDELEVIGNIFQK